MRTFPIFVVALLMLVSVVPVAAQTRTADDAAIEKLYNDFFEALRQAGSQGAAGYLRQSGTISEADLRRLEVEARTALERNPQVGRPDSWTIVNSTELEGAPRFRTVYALTHHDSRPVAWRLRFYQKVTGVWVFIDVDWEVKYVDDFLRLPEIEFDAYRKQLSEKSGN